jgi:hypothetical protein
MEEVDVYTPPIPNGFLKCNLDAAIFFEHKCVGFDLCLRDYVFSTFL